MTVLVGQLVMLGTGDAITAERAQSSLALVQGGGEVLLVDASSGPILLRQLQDAGISLASVRHLVVTHRHFDHAGGVAPLLVALVPVREADLTVYAPPETLAALHVLLALTAPGVEGWMGERLRWHRLVPGTSMHAGDTAVTPFAVEHGIECVGLRLAQGGRTAVFSADTRPCAAVVAYGAGADLLVHEAYGLAEEAAQAHRFGHATGADAGEVARAGGVGRLLLTHVRSPVSADPTALAAEAGAVFAGPVAVACDLDVIDF